MNDVTKNRKLCDSKTDRKRKEIKLCRLLFSHLLGRLTNYSNDLCKEFN